MYNINFVLSLILNIILNLCFSENVFPTALDAKVARFSYVIFECETPCLEPSEGKSKIFHCIIA